MAEARISIATQYEDPDANPDFATDFPNEPAPVPVVIRPHAHIGRITCEEQSVGTADVADELPADEAIVIDFGDVAEAQGFVLKNLSGQDLSVAINGMVSGTAQAAVDDLETVLAAQLALLNAFDDQDAIADVIAAIATAKAAIEAAQADLEPSDSIFTLPHGGVLACVVPPDATLPVESISLYTTDEQAGDGTVDYKIFGSAAP